MRFIHKQAHSYKDYECSQDECGRTTDPTETRPQNRIVRIRVIALVETISW